MYMIRQVRITTIELGCGPRNLYGMVDTHPFTSTNPLAQRQVLNPTGGNRPHSTLPVEITDLTFEFPDQICDHVLLCTYYCTLTQKLGCSVFSLQAVCCRSCPQNDDVPKGWKNWRLVTPGSLCVDGQPRTSCWISAGACKRVVSVGATIFSPCCT